MNNKETLQGYNERLSTNNDTITNINSLLKRLPVGGEDLTEELTNYDTSLTTQETSIQDIIKALEGKAAGGGGGGEPLEYISDGLIAWFDGYDDMDENGHWNNRVGDDYIYIYYQKEGDYNTNPIPHVDNGYVNSMNYCLSTTADYYHQDYTIEVVGKINSNANSDSETSGGWLFTMNETGAWGVGVIGGKIRFVNNESYSSDFEITNMLGKIFTGSLFINKWYARGKEGVSTNHASINGCPWFNVTESSSAHSTVVAQTHPILSYYTRSGSKYMADGTIHCIRVYNRKLTEEELRNNSIVDRLRFKF